MLPAVPWWAWAAIAALLGLGELHAPGAYLIWIAVAAAATAIAEAAFGLSLEAQVGAFLAAAALSCVGGYFVYGRNARDRALNERARSAIGAHGVACTEFVDGRGKVRLGDSVWLAEGGDLGEGTPVVVRSVHGTTLVVEPAARAGDIAAGEPR